MYTKQLENQKVKIWSIILAIISILIGLISLRYALYGVDAAQERSVSFPIASTQVETQVHPIKGTFYQGFAQTSGSIGTQYTKYYKLASAASYTNMATTTIYNNNYYYGPFRIAKPDGYHKYSLKLKKLNYTNKASVISWDYIVN